MKNITEILRDMFVPRRWKIIAQREVQGQTANTSGGSVYTLQDQYGNLKSKWIRLHL
jgi:hypothetical protein